MAFQAVTGSALQGAVDQAAKVVSVQLLGSWSGLFSSGSDYARPGFAFGPGSASTLGPLYSADGSFGWFDGGNDSASYEYTPGSVYTGFSTQSKFPCDTTCYYQAHVEGWNDAPGGFRTSRDGTLLSFLSYAIDAVANTPSSSSVTSSTATIACNYYPNTNESTATVKLEYKRVVDSVWTQAGSADSSQTGYTVHSISRNLTGLQPSTQYQFRLQITRTTANATTLTSATSTFTTLAGTPDVTTNAASSVGVTSATLNGTVNANGISTSVTFVWGTTNGGPYPNETSPPTTLSDSSPHAVSASIDSLTANTAYYFKCKAVAAGVTYLGAQQTFTTQQDPGVTARNQEMLPIQTFKRKYGVATTIFFHVPQNATGSSDLFYSGAAVWSAAGGEVKITKVTYNDTKTPTVTGPANASNDPAQVSGMVYRLDLEAAEMQADEIFITLTNAGTSVRDIALRVVTQEQLGSVIYDPVTGQRANTTGFTAKGYQAGSGILAVAGATGKDINGFLDNHVLRRGTAAGGGAGYVDLDSGAVGTDGYYALCVVEIVGGTGVGQSRVVITYTGSSKRCTVDASWTVNPDNTSIYVIKSVERAWQVYRGELSALPADNAAYGDKMQLLFQRFAFKIEQTATVQTWRKADNTNALTTRSVSDSGGTQTIGKLVP